MQEASSSMDSSTGSGTVSLEYAIGSHEVALKVMMAEVLGGVRGAVEGKEFTSQRT